MQTGQADNVQNIELIKAEDAVTKRKHNDTNFIKFIAIMLITNSHCDAFFPLKFLGTGGALGNCLFFLVSGYAITLSRSINLPFLSWFYKRIKRIYPPVIIMSLLVCVLPNINKLNIPYLFSTLVFPTKYWFIGAIMVFYAMFYFVDKFKITNKYLIFIGLLTIPYFYFYQHLDTSKWVIESPGYFRWIFYFQIMLFGGYLSSIKDKLKGDSNDFVIAMVLFIVYFWFKLLTNKYLIFMNVQFILQLVSFPLVYYILKVSKSEFIDKIMNSKILGTFAVLLAGLTLEIFTTQFVLIDHLSKFNLSFPVNILLFGISVIGASILLRKVCSKLQNFL